MGTAYDPPSGRDPVVRPPGATASATPATSAGAADRAVARVRAARRDPSRVRLEGVHAVKHALRFGAEIEVLVTPDRAAVATLLAELAPDVPLPPGTCELDVGTWRTLVPHELPSPLLAVAHRPKVTAADVLSAPGRILVLESPRHLGNLGATVRVAAAADAGGVLIVGDADPWHPTAVRAAAGLQFALPVARADRLPETQRPIVALDPEGTSLTATSLPSEAILLVGTERGGLSPELTARATTRVRLPMRPGVSSLNLATAVAAALYGAAASG